MLHLHTKDAVKQNGQSKKPGFLKILSLEGVFL